MRFKVQDTLSGYMVTMVGSGFGAAEGMVVRAKPGDDIETAVTMATRAAIDRYNERVMLALAAFAIPEQMEFVGPAVDGAATTLPSRKVFDEATGLDFPGVAKEAPPISVIWDHAPSWAAHWYLWMDATAPDSAPTLRARWMSEDRARFMHAPLFGAMGSDAPMMVDHPMKSLRGVEVERVRHPGEFGSAQALGAYYAQRELGR